MKNSELKDRREREAKDLEVESHRGERPLEGFSGGPTNWTQEQDDAEAATVHAQDAEASLDASRRQAEGDGED